MRIAWHPGEHPLATAAAAAAAAAAHAASHPPEIAAAAAQPAESHAPDHGQPPASSAPVPPSAGHGHTAAPPPAAGNPVDCTGYPEPRVFLEVQDWWLQTPGGSGTGFGHVHVGTCFPYGQTLTGPVDFDVRVVMHDNPGTLQRVDVGLHIGEDGVLVGIPFGVRCASTCTYWGRARLDTSAVGVDGWHEFRFKARVDEPDGNRMVTSTGWPAYIKNGHHVTSWRDGTGVTARGWYTDVGYQNATIAALPGGPVSGVWRPSLRLGPGAGGTPSTRHVVAVDPNAHAGDPGWVILDGPGEFRGEVSIDTRRLANGPHRLVLRTDSALDNGSTHSGLLVVSFVVSN